MATFDESLTATSKEKKCHRTALHRGRRLLKWHYWCTRQRGAAPSNAAANACLQWTSTAHRPACARTNVDAAKHGHHLLAGHRRPLARQWPADRRILASSMRPSRAQPPSASPPFESVQEASRAMAVAFSTRGTGRCLHARTNGSAQRVHARTHDMTQA